MPKKLQKSLQDYLSKIKKPAPNLQFSSNSFSSSKNWVLSGCKHPKTLSFAINREDEGNDNNNNNAARLSDVDRFLFENFKSLYLRDDDNDVKKYEGEGQPQQKQQVESPGKILFGSPRFIDPPVDLCGSNRFFVVPGLTGSLIEEARTSVTTTTTNTDGTSEDTGSSSTSTYNTLHDAKDDDENEVVSLPKDCIAVLTYSPSPYNDFRRSMQDMVEERLRHNAKVDWEFMEELLFCYLNLNDKKSYKFILSAFVDLITVLRQNSSKAPARPRSFRFTRERVRRRMRHVA